LKSYTASFVRAENDGKTAQLYGWVHERRNLGGIKFILLRDSSGLAQVTASKKSSDPSILTTIDELTPESVVYVEGTVQKSTMAKIGAELIPTKIELLNKAMAPLPLDPSGKVPAEIETRLNARFIDLRRPEPLAIFRIAHVVLQVIRDHLSNLGFLEVITPRILGSATEGGANLFKVDYYGQPAYLSQSPQLYKEVLTSSLERVFEIGPFFREEESHTTYHLSEFVSVDIETAFATAEDVMKILEDLIVEIFASVKVTCKEELQTLGVDLRIPEKPFKRLPYQEALREVNDSGLEMKFGDDLHTLAMRKLGEKYPSTCFVTHWPTRARTFYIMPEEENPDLCHAFDLNYGFVEIASGGKRIHTRKLLEKRLSEQGLNPKDFRSHLEAFDYGMPPHAGWAFGLGRLLTILTGVPNIREVVLFPRDQNRLTP
jgi:nondiscriminating aspartyl-tRNA synthetase